MIVGGVLVWNVRVRASEGKLNPVIVPHRALDDVSVDCR